MTPKLSMTFSLALMTAAFLTGCQGSSGGGGGGAPVQELSTQVTQFGLLNEGGCALQNARVICWGNLSKDFSMSGSTPGVFLYYEKDSTFSLLATGANFLCVNGTTTYNGTSKSYTDSRVVCVGDNKFNQTQVPVLKDVKALTAGKQHACAIDANGVTCWGDFQEDQKEVPPGLTHASLIAAGENHTCAVQDGKVACWGANEKGQSKPPANLSGVVAISAGSAHSCALNDRGDVRCWGDNSMGQLSVPLDLPVITQLVSGANHTCAVSDTGGVLCWGDNSSGQSQVPSTLPAVRLLSANATHTCAITSRGYTCWGPEQQIEAKLKPLAASTNLQLWNTSACGISAGQVQCLDRKGQPLDSAAASNLFAVTSVTGVEELRQWNSFLCAKGPFGVRCAGLDVKLTGTDPLTIWTPADIGKYNSGFCAVRNGQLVCTPSSSYVTTLAPIADATIQELAASNYSTCYVSAAGATCISVDTLAAKAEWSGLHPHQLQGDSSHLCATTDEGIHCLGYQQEDKLLLPLSKADLSGLSDYWAKDGGVCAKIADQFRCSGALDAFVKNVEGIDQVALNSSTGLCFLQGSQVTCRTLMPPPYNSIASPPLDLGPVSRLIPDASGMCAVTSHGLRCWGDHFSQNGSGETFFPSKKN